MSAPRIAIWVDTATGWGRRLVQGVLDYSLHHGPWDLWLEAHGPADTFIPPDSKELDGIIARVSTPEIAEAVRQLNVPAINVSAMNIAGSTFPQVTTDGHAAAKLAVQHFRDRGIRHFAYVGPMGDSCVRAHERAFETQLQESGTPCEVFAADTGMRGALSWSEREEHLIPWLRGLPKPVGIFTWGFQVGRDIVSACRSAAIQVPHDIAVLGGDYDHLLSNACHPALSGIITPAQQIGTQAATLLAAAMKGEPLPNGPLFLAPEEIEECLSTDTLAIEDPHVLQALVLIRRHGLKDVHIKDLLAQVPIARRTVERNFVKLLGRTPAEEMRRFRINHARSLLAKSTLPMQEIAEACGYATYNHLGSVFKKETGMSMGQYRKAIR